MEKRSPWEPRSLLDFNPWSLLPVVGLSKTAAIVAQVAWAGFVLLFYVQRPWDWISLMVSWGFGAWAVFYITQRLGGRAAILGGATPAIRPDSPFQARLLGDVLYIFVLITFLAVVVFGTDAVRTLLARL